MTGGRLRHRPFRAESEFFAGERCHILELINDTARPGLSIARARVEPGVTTELHALDVDEVYVVLSGRGRMEGGGDESFPVAAGDCVEIPAGAPQRITNVGDEDLVFLCVCTPRFRPEGYRALEADPDGGSAG